MRIVGGILGGLGGLSLMYFGIHQLLGKMPFPFSTEDGVKLGAALCTIVMLVGFLLINKSRKQSAEEDADSKAGETKPKSDN
jgi:hypothetical protein